MRRIFPKSGSRQFFKKRRCVCSAAEAAAENFNSRSLTAQARRFPVVCLTATLNTACFFQLRFFSTARLKRNARDHVTPFAGCSRSVPPAPHTSATIPAVTKAAENDCVASATAPAKYGPKACPMPKTIVIKPRAAGASRAPNTSPARAAMSAGMLHAVNANNAEEK